MISLLETLLVAGAFQAYVLLFRGRDSLPVDGVVLALLTAIVILLFVRRGESPRSLGITDREAARRAVRSLLPLLAIIVVASIAFRLGHGPLRRPRRMFPGFPIALLTYPIWGFLQQLFYLGFFTRGLVRGGVPAPAAAVLGGLAYGFIHAPNWPLVAVTTPMGLWLALVYIRAPSLLASAVVHGIGGAFALYVLGMNLEIGSRFTLLFGK